MGCCWGCVLGCGLGCCCGWARGFLGGGGGGGGPPGGVGWEGLGATTETREISIFRKKRQTTSYFAHKSSRSVVRTRAVIAGRVGRGAGCECASLCLPSFPPNPPARSLPPWKTRWTCTEEGEIFPPTSPTPPARSAKLAVGPGRPWGGPCVCATARLGGLVVGCTVRAKSVTHSTHTHTQKLTHATNASKFRQQAGVFGWD